MRIRAVIAACFLAVGCGQLIGADEYGVEDYGPHAGILAFLPSECSACIEATCPDQLSLCESSTPCAELGRCFAEMPGPAHRAACQARYPQMAALHTELGRCMGRSCAGECGAGSAWSCISQATETAQPIEPDFEYRVQLAELITQAPAPGLRVRACDRVGWTDPECVESLQRMATTDANGRVTLRIPFRTLGIRQAWDGYLLIDGPNYYPDLRLFTQPIAADLDITVTAISLTTLTKLSAAYHVEQAPERGMLSATVLDCWGIPAAGVRFELVADPPMERFYSAGAGLLSRKATVTSPDGIVLFTNVRSGRHILRAYLDETGALIGEYDLYVAPGRRTVIFAETN